MKNKSNQSQNTAICADTIPATQSKHNLYHKITSRIKPNYLGLAMSVLLIIGAFVPSYGSSGVLLSGYNVTLYEMTAYSDYTFFFLLAIGIFSIIVSVIGFDVGVILGGVGECVVTFIQFRRYFTEDFSSIPVELNIGFYILVFASIVLLLSGFLGIPKTDCKMSFRPCKSRGEFHISLKSNLTFTLSIVLLRLNLVIIRSSMPSNELLSASSNKSRYWLLL